MPDGFLPVTKEELLATGCTQPDFVFVTGDAYVDHPSFAPAIISRVLVSHGYSVCMIPQPDWHDEQSISVFGEPRLGFLVCSGNMDSMVNHYTVSKKKRNEDAFSPGGRVGCRPDRADIVYCNLIRKIYKKTPIILGGIEASLRRLAHYDYWSDKMRRSILLESGADLIIYGMGERAVVDIADALASGLRVQDLSFIRGTVFKTRDRDLLTDGIMLPDYEEICDQPRSYAQSFRIQYENTDAITAKALWECYDHSLFVVQNPPAMPLSEMELDDVYELPYMRAAHPMYDKDGGIPAISEIKFSLTSNRGCFGNCHFCSLTFHQGRHVQGRSKDSLIREAQVMIKDKDFKGYIHDVGGPTANFMQPSCKKQLEKGLCKHQNCMTPTPCKQLEVTHEKYLDILRSLRKLDGVKKVFVRSGVRYDYAYYDPDDTFLRELIKYHISGQLRVAPEHVNEKVLEAMGKPSKEVYFAFLKRFARIQDSVGKNRQSRDMDKLGGNAGKSGTNTSKKPSELYAVPYFMSSHPGCGLKEAVELAEYIHGIGFIPRQVQDFYPTPSTMSTVMYATGIDPLTMNRIYVAKSAHEKAMQRALMQYNDPKNYDLVKEALLTCGRRDLIGFEKKCLIPPRRIGEAKDKKPKRKNVR